MSERDKKMVIKITESKPTYIMFRCIFEESDYHIDDMPELKFDLFNMIEVDSMDQFLKRLGQAAYMQCSKQEQEENMKDYPVSKLNFHDLVNHEIEMTLGEAYSANNHSPKGFIRYRKKPWYRRLFGKS